MEPLKILSPLHKAKRQIEIYLEAHIRADNVTVIEGHLLAYLLVYSPASVGELSQMTGLKPSTMTSILDRMEERGFLERKPNPDDRRSWLVSLSPAGTELAKRMRAMVEEFEAEVLGELSDTELEGFRRVFEVIERITSIRTCE